MTFSVGTATMKSKRNILIKRRLIYFKKRVWRRSVHQTLMLILQTIFSFPVKGGFTNKQK